MKDLDFYKRRDEVLRIGKRAVKEAQRKSLENGVPNVYSRNGKLYYELPDGTITSETPKEYKDLESEIQKGFDSSVSPLNSKEVFEGLRAKYTQK